MPGEGLATFRCIFGSLGKSTQEAQVPSRSSSHSENLGCEQVLPVGGFVGI